MNFQINRNDDHCQVTLIYLGGPTNVDFNSKSVEIVVMQQHCGGENLLVFKNHLKPNGSTNNFHSLIFFVF